MALIEYDQLAQQYERNRKANPAVLQDLISGCQLNELSKVLEVGCGTGNYISAIARSVGCRCWGVDPSARMLEIAQQHAGGNLVFTNASAEGLPFEDGFFDLIFSVDVIHHLPSRDAYFTRVHKRLAPTGCLCTVTDSEEIIRTREPLSRYFPETVEVELRRYPSIQRLKEELRRAHFDVIRETTTDLPYSITDLTPYAERSYSSLHIISDEAFNRGIARMKADLAAAPIRAVARYTHIWAKLAVATAGSSQ